MADMPWQICHGTFPAISRQLRHGIFAMAISRDFSGNRPGKLPATCRQPHRESILSNFVSMFPKFCWRIRHAKFAMAILPTACPGHTPGNFPAVAPWAVARDFPGNFSGTGPANSRHPVGSLTVNRFLRFFSRFCIHGEISREWPRQTPGNLSAASP